MTPQPSSAAFTRRDAAHLLTRAGFGATAAEIERAHGEGLDATVERLLKPAPESASFEKTTSLLRRSALSGDNIAGLKAWWFYRMANTANPLLEKTALFWHNHFATSWAKVKSVGAMADQNALIREHALGDFRKLATGMMRDVAMLEWLDANANRKRHPNENLARELMELFTLGVGNYTEHDIKEAARAFSGWHVRNEKFWFNKTQHDSGMKTVFGKSGKFGGDDILRLCLEQEACSSFLAQKLLTAFATPDPDPIAIVTLAESIRACDFDMGKVMSELLRSEYFFAASSRRAIIKSPADLVVGTYRALGNRANLPASNQLMAELGQSLFEPPTVKGWEGGRLWINATSMLQRANFAADLVSSDRYGRIAKPQASIDYAELLLGRKLDSLPRERDLRGRIQLILSTPEYQLL